MGWVFVAILITIIVGTFIIGTGRGGQQAPAVEDRPVPQVPDAEELGPENLAGLKFAVVARGYSMPQVDELLERITIAWQRDRAELATLKNGAQMQLSADRPLDAE